jgi:hypothetical protein
MKAHNDGERSGQWLGVCRFIELRKNEQTNMEVSVSSITCKVRNAAEEVQAQKKIEYDQLNQRTDV